MRPLAYFALIALFVPALLCAQSVATGDTTFTLEPGDVIQVTVWREKDLTGKFAVDERGRVVLPMIGMLTVTDRPWTAVRDSLLEEYQRQLRNPSVTLTPLRRVQVLGQVTKPGQYFADPTVSLAGLVALAGGATPEGDLRHVRVVRNGKTIVNSTPIESLVLQTGAVHSDDQIFVDRQGWLARNGAITASILVSAAGILVTIILR